MYESASTLPVGYYGGPEHAAYEASIVHEGDWEFFQVVVKLDTDNQVATAIAASYSIHYYGVSLPWDGIDEKQVDNIGHTPYIYVASGAHATYPNVGKWPTPITPGHQDYYPVMWDEDRDVGHYDLCENFGGNLFYAMIPLGEYGIWKGHWGAKGSPLLPGSDGPPSPHFRTGGHTGLYSDPQGYFNNMLPPEFDSLAIP